MRFKSETLNFRQLVTLIQQGYAEESMSPIHPIKYGCNRRAYKSGTSFNRQTLYSKYCKRVLANRVRICWRNTIKATYGHRSSRQSNFMSDIAM